jgi:hypothetical protein
VPASDSHFPAVARAVYVFMREKTDQVRGRGGSGFSGWLRSSLRCSAGNLRFVHELTVLNPEYKLRLTPTAVNPLQTKCCETNQTMEGRPILLYLRT